MTAEGRGIKGEQLRGGDETDSGSGSCNVLERGVGNGRARRRGPHEDRWRDDSC